MTRDSRLVTVIGGTGFLGSYIVRGLIRQGYRVRVLCRDTLDVGDLRTQGELGAMAFEYFDLTKPEHVAEKLAGSWAVVNLVGVLFEKGRQKFSRLHTQGAKALASAARDVGAERFVQISALGIDKATGSSYARSKLEGEKAVLAAFPGAVILRPSVVFGREDRFFNTFAAMAVKGFMPLIGGGRTRFQPIYVADVAAAVCAVLDRDDASGRIYELAGPEVMSLRHIYEFIARTLRRQPHYIGIPFGIASLMGSVAQFLPVPPLTADQVRLLRTDSMADGRLPGLKDLGIAPTAIELIVPEYLARFESRAFAVH